jgi:phage tail-like protein
VDVNGSQFHLIKGQADWSRCRLEGQPTAVTDWIDAGQKRDQPPAWLKAGWEAAPQTVTLNPLLPLFVRGGDKEPLALDRRRGTAVDQYGNWYWIGQDRRRLYWQPAGSKRASLYWEQATTDSCPAPGSFTGEPAPTGPAELAGLAVTSHHYLVVGNLTEPGLFIFDLHAGGEPTLLRWPADTPFTPFAIAAAPDGGVWVLDRTHRTYWGLDRTFRLRGEPALLVELSPAATADFQPLYGEMIVRPSRHFPTGFPLPAAEPIGIVALPDGSVLILDRPEADASSLLHHLRLSQPQPGSPLPLPDLAAMTDETESRPLVGHDMAYIPAAQTLVVATRSGVQAFAFRLRSGDDGLWLQPKRDYLPLYAFGGRALAGGATGEQIYYDVVGQDAVGQSGAETAVRWLPLQAIDRPRYERTARLHTWLLDGKVHNCVWHRIFVDGCLPPDTAVTISTRAHNDPDLLATVPFSQEPDLYRRGRGAEIPHYDPFAGRDRLPEGAGTFELLCQQARGRYLEVQIEMQGNGQVTPQLHALRVYYPRFSYPENYLPAVFMAEPEPASFLERLLANMEGIYTELEGQMVHAAAFFDPRQAPPEALDWLAGWLGLLLDPLWGQLQQQRRLPFDRRRLFIRYGRTLFRQRGTLNGIRFGLHLLLEPGLEQMLGGIKQAAARSDHPWRQRLAAYDLPIPSPTSSEAFLEDLLHAYILQRPSPLRIVERFRTRDGRALVAGDSDAAGSATSAESIAAAAHRFSVLIPEGLAPEEEAMVGHIINLEKPAHTQFDLRYYWAGFRIGEARLGLDTAVADTPRFFKMILGQHSLAYGYLSPSHPHNVADRHVIDRDRLGKLPSL